MQRILFTLILSISLFSGISAQDFSVSGIITDEAKIPLIGATVLEKGTVNATVTDFDGRFSLVLSDSTATLIVSSTGFRSQELSLDGETNELELRLGEEVALEEVVINGYSKGRKSRSTLRSKSVPASPGFAPAASPSPSRSYTAEPMSARSETRVAYTTADADYSGSAVITATQTAAAAGTLTAGEIHDFSKWDLWQDIAAEDLMNWREFWQIYPAQRYPVQLTNQNGKAVVNAVVKLMDQNRNTVWQARTDNTGKAELWDHLFSARKGENRQLRILVEHEDREFPLEQISSFQQGYNFMSIPVDCETNSAVDIVFVVDATGSMKDEIDYLKAELQDVIERVKDTLPETDLNLGSVFYRDRGEAYVTQKTPLSSVIRRTTDFIKEQDAEGGGDHPEAVEEALRVAVEDMDWRSDATTRLMFVVLDAPPHQSPEILSTLERVTLLAAAKGIRIIPIACSGIDKSTEYLMRALALATNGTYTFLTDDSGVGYSHIEPTTDRYDVEKLNGLLARVIYQFSYVRDCEELPVIAANSPVDTGMVFAKLELPKKEKTELPQLSLRFYPNPSSGPVNVEANGIGELFLADFSGKILERFAIRDTKSTIDMSRYPAGTYHLRFRTDEDQWLGDELVLMR